MLPAFWKEFLVFLEKDKKSFPLLYSLLKQLSPIELTNERLVLGCENQGFKFFLNTKVDEIERALLIHSKQRLSVSFFVLEKKTKKEAPLLSFQPAVNDVLRIANLSDRYGFDNFAVSSTNQVAYAASQAVVDSLGKAYNPLFLYGGVGVGKTHLAQAVGRKILENGPQKRVLFCPSEQFINELIEAIRGHTTQNFRKKYRKLDLLIIDDVQFIAGKQTVQEDFFHTFNSIISFGGQIIMTSDRHPTEIQNLEDRLRSRFSQGLSVDIQEPDFELRTAILLIKAKEKGIDIDINAARIIAEQIEDARAVEGTLISIYAKIIGKKTSIDLEAVDSFFTGNAEKKIKRVSPSDVIKAVCSYYHIKQSQIKGETRIDEVALPRQIVMYILRNELKMKLDQIAFILRRKDHTTVIHATNKVSRLAVENPSFKEELDRITRSINL